MTRLVGPEDVLRAVAVMHVEIDDGRALEPVALLRVARRDRGVVEQAEAHRPRRLGVVAGRAHGDEGVRRLLVHHLVDREHGAADAAQRRLEAAGRHRSVGVDAAPWPRLPGGGARGSPRHSPSDGRARRSRACAHRRLLARQDLEPLVLQRLLDGAQAIRPLGMAHRASGG